MASIVYSFALQGIDGQVVEVETDTMVGMSSVSIVGLGDKAVKEARERLEAAMLSSGFVFPVVKVVFNLAPSDMKKTGTHYDLAMAIGLLLRSNQIPEPKDLNQTAFIGELSLNANIRGSSGVLPMVLKAKEVGIKKILLPVENVQEARLVKGVEIYGCRDLREAVGILGGKVPEKLPLSEIGISGQQSTLDFIDVKGQEIILDYMVIAAAGGHNLLMIGPPGCGKSMIAKRIPTILPEMSEKESLEVTKIYSIASMLHEKGTLITKRPFRAPHHNASTNSLIGGGPFAKPGEISFAHNGVLFLDEIAEFSRKTLDALRQPLEDQMVTITRVLGLNSYPANFMLVGAMNPCPCGYFGSEKCRCTDYEIIKYRQRLSGPIIDRMDIQKYVNNVNFFSSDLPSKSSAELKVRVDYARKIQEKRYKHISGISSNAQLTASLITQFCPLDSETTSLLQKAYDRFKYSGRSLHKFIKVARTIADLEGEKEITSNHMRVSLQSRDLDKDAFHLFGGSHG
ncbi:YifB family Mg chelatase-like AAA ATPase [Robertmurraya korlensis]|uniref:YifB family Mg chelatase-like AAA ATPase n=1 Tax=Robertmurraya korlensis TaxID=519977 RepID=UPI002041A628|nr:YifB family Mg chelatase-like AAA ATPase [Robertmurraya korlensis]MCM3602159.1 YifB family Mg chelatase-like AAA ATPase [Robertmurraya korlensis]